MFDTLPDDTLPDQKAQEKDDAEDAQYGQGRRGDEIPEELRFKEKRLQTLRAAKERLEKRTREKAIEEGKLNPDGTPKPPRGRPPQTPPGQPEPKAQENFTDPDIPPSREKKLGDAPPPRGRIPKGLSLEGRMRRKLRTKRGRATYGKRKGIVEPVFGQMKFGRGLRQFLLRGLEYVALEWDLWCIGHNLLKLWASGWHRRTQTA